MSQSQNPLLASARARAELNTACSRRGCLALRLGFRLETMSTVGITISIRVGIIFSISVGITISIRVGITISIRVGIIISIRVGIIISIRVGPSAGVRFALPLCISSW